MTMKLLWRLAGATLCCVLIIKLMLVVEFISFTSIITQDRLRQQFLRQFRSRGGHWNNSFSRSSDSRSSDPLLRLFKNSNAARLGVVKKASETVIPCNVTDYPMGVAVGTLVRVLKENGSSDIEQRVGYRFRLIKQIGTGGFGKVFLGVDISNEEKVAIKMERPEKRHSLFQTEELIYRLLQDGEGFPIIKWSGTEGEHNMIATELLGPSLGNMMQFCSEQLSLKTVLLIADQLISRLEYMHSKHIINRDVKPHNFLVGMGTKWNIIYCIDFGLSRRYRDEDTLEHIPYAVNETFAGTLRYSTINTQLGIVQSRRDDMESLGYVLIYLLRGTLPWQSIKRKTRDEKHAQVLKIKQSTPLEKLSEGLPKEFLKYLHICRSMGFEEKPNYTYLRKLFSHAYKKHNFTTGKYFDWNVPKGRCQEKVQHKLALPSSELGIKGHDNTRL